MSVAGVKKEEEDGEVKRKMTRREAKMEKEEVVEEGEIEYEVRS